MALPCLAPCTGVAVEEGALDDFPPDRKLAAILALDVVGFSAMMNQDEVGTLRRVQSLQKKIVEPCVREHRGHVFKLIGDGALSHFQSAHDALASAIEILGQLSNSDLDIKVRLGLHVGDVIFEDGDVFGDGVNIAARLEGVAKPNSIALSERAWSDVNKAFSGFDDLGLVPLKNIKVPLRVFGYTPNERDRVRKRRFKLAKIAKLMGTLVALLTLAGLGAYYWRYIVNSPEAIVKRGIDNYTCSWLTAKQVASGNGVSRIEIKGGLGGDKALLRRNLMMDLARRWREPVELTTEEVNNLPSSLCKFTERFKPYRYDGPPRISLAKVERTIPGMSFDLDGKAGHTLYIRVYTKTFRPTATLFAIWPTGEVFKFGKINALSDWELSGYNSEIDGAKQLAIATPVLGSAAFLVIDSAKPIPISVLKDGRLDVDSLDKLDAVAKEGDWRIEMIGYDLAAWEREMSAKR